MTNEIDWPSVYEEVRRLIIEGGEPMCGWTALSKSMGMPHQTIAGGLGRLWGLKVADLPYLPPVSEIEHGIDRSVPIWEVYGRDDEIKAGSGVKQYADGSVESSKFVNEDTFREEIEDKLGGLQKDIDLDNPAEVIFELVMKTPELLMRYHGYDPETWVIVWADSNVWTAMKAARFGNPRVPMFQSKVKLKPRSGEFAYEDVKRFFDGLKIPVKSTPVKPIAYHKKGKVLEICIADLHLEMIPAEEQEQTIAESMLMTVMEIKRRVIDEGHKISLIELVNIGDFFHVDTFKKTTSSGTQLETAVTAVQMFDNGMKLMIQVIDALKELAPVEVIVLPGNHDWTYVMMMAKSLEIFYANDRRVSVDADEMPQKTRKFGATLVGWTHGNMSKKNLMSWLQKSEREMWGQTEYSEIHAGHIHKEFTDEEYGIKLRHVPHLAPQSAWELEKGFYSELGTHAFLWDLDKGLYAIWNIKL